MNFGLLFHVAALLPILHADPLRSVSVDLVGFYLPPVLLPSAFPSSLLRQTLTRQMKNRHTK